MADGGALSPATAAAMHGRIIGGAYFLMTGRSFQPDVKGGFANSPRYFKSSYQSAMRRAIRQTV